MTPLRRRVGAQIHRDRLMYAAVFGRMDWDKVKCRVGLHKWEAATTADASGEAGVVIVRDWQWCMRIACRFSQPRVMNIERRRL